MVSEKETLIDTPLLGDVTYREWHAILDGIYCGIHSSREHEYGTEKHYWRVGWLLGDAYDRIVR